MTTPSSDAPTWPDLLTALLRGQDLPAEHTRWAMGEVMRGEATPVQLAGFLVALTAKGLTTGELTGLADEMLEHAHRISVPGTTVDIVGTGGDRHHSVNISTMASLVAAGAGMTVVKHGNRAASSSTGSADVLEALGVDLTIAPERVARIASEAGITFCFAQAFHPSMRHAAVARRELGIGTAFNILGPLTNPGQPTYAALGVADPSAAPLIAGVFAARGRTAIVTRGDDGLDEVTLSTTTSVWLARNGEVTTHTLDPAHHGIARAPLEDLRGGDAEFNATVVRQVLAGERGAPRDAVLINAAVALALPMIDSGVAVDEAVSQGLAQATAAVDSGSAAAVLDRWVAATRRRD
ncbi:anthranilate phosphoribosyltransferase [Nostocoides sp. F2B08]|uniref:anthranilate phosphoribosyltransferase n=1 Tax=Nostocoides sp. F2B08 TaxID=2653936 RepID=UPI001D0519D6|nr:anthranilate phosphoribosyltransferase [Tetrasphaera sp. F2B08]